jgi:cytochrome c oxidase subunit IV
LALITVAEVLFALLGNGHLIHGLHFPKWVMYPVMIGATLYKAYFIVYEFMHMKYEVKGLAMSVLLPTLLLVWGIIAFFQEGNSWKNRRQLIKDKNRSNIESAKPHGMNIVPATTKVL